MAERVGDFEWRGEGEGAEIVLYAPTDDAFGRVSPAARLPGVQSPVYAASSRQDFGWCAVSSTHAAPDLVSVPACGLLLAADASIENLTLPPQEIPRLLYRNLSEVSLPRPGGAGLRSICEAGARAAAEYGLIEEEDLPFFASIARGFSAGEPDTLGRRGSPPVREAGSAVRRRERLRGGGDPRRRRGRGAEPRTGDAGGRRQYRSGRSRADRARRPPGSYPGRRLRGRRRPAGGPSRQRRGGGSAGGRPGVRQLRRRAGGPGAVCPAAGDRKLRGELRLLAAWTTGGFEEREGLLLHRRELAQAGSGAALVSGGTVAVATGVMLGSAPPFGVEEADGVWPWEEGACWGGWRAWIGSKAASVPGSPPA